MPTSQPDTKVLSNNCLALIESSRTLLLSTYSSEGGADIGYAPYVRDGLAFYLYVSDLARHTANMLSTLQAAVMFIQPEAECRNVFARERVVLDCRVREIGRSDTLYERQLLAMQHKFGETVTLLRSLPDFHLLQLQAASGRYIAGFGQAYAIDTATGSLIVTARDG
ncbi:HugZ family pyridoxamine 5'-phosphate oxidase [Methylomarinum vadi]|uniref:HugZ family pyridoxamine 5'-phosphate oxidase n=1 Tax=Methylomarinum vadi TaxID=438855 RepID=UPI0004DF70A4|nr:pyridoxamine 5'-phosphate oxidase family protein [Methylomarinum vadi]